MTIQQLAAEAYRYLRSGDREADGIGKITVPTDDAPDWFTDLCRRAHDQARILPDDWRYEFIRDALSLLEDTEPDDDPDEVATERIEADTYTHDLTAWLNSSLDRLGYVDEAIEEWGVDLVRDGAWRGLAMGQVAERREVFSSVLQSLRDRAEELEEVEA